MKDKLAPVRSLLRTQTTLVLATVGDEGAPRSTPLFFISDEHLNLYWFSSRSSLHSRNSARFPVASAAISTGASTWQEIRGVQMQGRISAVTDRALRQRITVEYVERFALGKLFSIAIRGSALYCFTPSWVRYIDNSKRFGYKVEFDLSESAGEEPGY